MIPRFSAICDGMGPVVSAEFGEDVPDSALPKERRAQAAQT
jgi:hypothetical protein